MPDHKKIREHKCLQFLGEHLHNPNLWHLNRRSVAGAFAVGIFCAFIPLPFQMIFAAVLAVLMGTNLPISVTLVWITNPITIPPMFYTTYKVGAWLLNIEPEHFDIELSVEWFMHEMSVIWEPLLLGSLLVGTICSLLVYFIVRGLWRLHIVRHYQRKRAKRHSKHLP